MTRPFGYGPEPIDWTKTTLRPLLVRRKVTGRPDLPLLSVNLHQGVVKRVEGDGRPAPSEDLSGYQVVRPGDLVMNQLGKPHGALGVSDYKGIISPAYFVAEVTPLAHPRFLHWLLRTRLYISEYERRGKFMPPNQFDIGWDQFRDIGVLLPPLGVQRAVANFLDAETARIDGLIEKKRRILALLAERKQATIDATVEGAGPEVQVRHLISHLTSGPRGWATYASGEGTPFIRITNIQRSTIELDMRDTLYVHAPRTAESLRTQVRAGDVFVSITADIGSVAIARASQAGANISQHVALLRPSGCIPEWLAYSISTTAAQAQLDAGQYGGTKTQLGLDDIRELRIPLPGRKTQETLLVPLAEKLSMIEATTDRLNRQVDLLAEQRQALITAAVTGVLQVPAAAA